MTKISVKVKNKTYEADATDSDAIFFTSLIAPNLEQVIKKDTGIQEALSAIASDREAMNTSKEEEERVQNLWSDRLMGRINYNLEIRSALAQRIQEIFPEMAKDGLVDFKTWTDGDGQRFLKASIRLSVQELVIDMIPAVASAITDSVLFQKDKEPPTPKAKQPKGFAKMAAEAKRAPAKSEEVEAEEVESSEVDDEAIAQATNDAARLKELQAEMQKIKERGMLAIE